MSLYDKTSYNDIYDPMKKLSKRDCTSTINTRIKNVSTRNNIRNIEELSPDNVKCIL